MASILLSTAGAALGSATGVPFAGQIGALAGRSIGGFVDDQIFGTATRNREGARLENLAVQTSTYGKMIPIVYGRARMAGNIIWSRPIEETATTSTTTSGGAGGKGGGGRVTTTSTTYSYSISLAVAVCEGEIDSVLRIWADAKQLNMSQYTLRIYTGSETQTADTYIQSIEGTANTPAYRGLAYVVLEGFPLADFGNRIPNFTFEVKKKAQYPDYNDEILEDVITGMTLIPGAGEFVLDTNVQYKISGETAGAGFAQQGSQTVINMHNASGEANVKLALDQLADTCPNLEWVSVIVGWFGDSLDAGTCVIKPGVEYQIGGTTTPDSWGVAGFSRSTATLITQIDGSPRYGGTPDDDSVVRLCTELQNRGYKVLFYPFLFMDVEGKPWRGQITPANATDAANFFTKTNGWNACITHYANLVKNVVDAFVIGSEFKALTTYSNSTGSFPAVTPLVNLAATVKTIVGSGVKVTYAADWSEYHQTNGWYVLDPLWASSNIDMVGIDAYFPLSDAPQSTLGYDIDTIIDGWTSGEGYDWYYTDAERTNQASLSDPFAWKNLDWWWKNTHTNPDTNTTSWVPESKKIWFTEYGFPSVDGATNEPNVFYDPNSSIGGLPRFSKGRIDNRAQRVALMATEQQWKNSSMVEQMFIWTWDARPFPYYPDLTEVWTDGGNWRFGHWVSGKLGVSSLAAIVADLCTRAGYSLSDIDVTGISEQVEGFVITGQQTIRSSIEQLTQAYFFDAVERDNVLTFIKRGGNTSIPIAESELVPAVGRGIQELLRITRAQELELPARIHVVYFNPLTNFQPATEYSQRQQTESRDTVTVQLPIVMSGQQAKTIADVSLFGAWLARTRYSVRLPISYVAVEPADLLAVTKNNVTHTMRVTRTRLLSPSLIEIEAVAEDISVYDFYTAPGDNSGLTEQIDPLAETELVLLDLPAFPTDDVNTASLRMGATGLGNNWPGSVVYRSDDGGTNYDVLTQLDAPAVIGAAVTVLADGPTTVVDEANSVSILLLGESELSSTNALALLNGANAALLGSEIIQFRTATLVSTGKYMLTGLLRGRLGTEAATSGHAVGEQFVLLNGLLDKVTMPFAQLNRQRHYKPVTIGSSLNATAAETFSYTGKSLSPLSPVHVAGTRDGSGNLSLSWIRRTRGGGEWLDYVDAPLNETTEAYEIDIMNGSNEVVRTIAGLTTPAASYTATEQVSDFGSTQSSITLRVYQLSGVIGRGQVQEVVV